ncbi:hypothetical protein SAMN06297129_3653 [Pseudooceanicola antarcticus]|uniref:Glyoxalase-related protein domain-containing protein n=1 Tax=Pseudooceanicola antarcticus TaxID=1247613 RepID=A0A285JFD2_9RHOB|nr:glyoxalase superfamily protein [Pseudooceanicola antarcticus]PJE31018.1 hypothetical protein CVM39_04285 [Pseudooceanicola antarcticus]SNY58955.1 hypothetical protein SAMN06297129_3653 [Pseudooceanicola antarcticus]
MTAPTVESVKAQARALRQELQARGTPVSHAEALEIVARQHGARDWNTLHARLGRRNAPEGLAPGDRVNGRYLGQAYRGKIVGLSGPQGFRQVQIALDEPVDSVTFESFSNWRHRLRGTIDETGVSRRRTSDGTPHLTVRKEGT